MDILILLISIVWVRSCMNCWPVYRLIIVETPMKFIRPCCLKIWHSRPMLHWLLSVKICWKVSCARSLNKGWAPFMEWKKYWPIHGLEKITTKSSCNFKFNHQPTFSQLLKSILMITQTKKRTKSKLKRWKNSRKLSERNSSRPWKVFTTITDQPTNDQELTKNKKHNLRIKQHVRPCSEEGVHQRSESQRIQVETVRRKTANQNKCIFIWRQKSKNWTFITIRRVHLRNWPTEAVEIIYSSIK